MNNTDANYIILFQSRNRETFDFNLQMFDEDAINASFQSRNRETFDFNFRL